MIANRDYLGSVLFGLGIADRVNPDALTEALNSMYESRKEDVLYISEIDKSGDVYAIFGMIGFHCFVFSRLFFLSLLPLEFWTHFIGQTVI